MQSPDGRCPRLPPPVLCSHVCSPAPCLPSAASGTASRCYCFAAQLLPPCRWQQCLLPLQLPGERKVVITCTSAVVLEPASELTATTAVLG